MSAHSEIRAALENNIANIAGVPPVADRAWENVDFKPTPGNQWVRMTLMTNLVRPAVLGSDPQKLYQGLFQIDVFSPEGTGPNGGDVLADAVRDAFGPGDLFSSGVTNVYIEWSERQPGRRDTPWYMIPVIIRWYTHRA